MVGDLHEPRSSDRRPTATHSLSGRGAVGSVPHLECGSRRFEPDRPDHSPITIPTQSIVLTPFPVRKVALNGRQLVLKTRPTARLRVRFLHLPPSQQVSWQSGNAPVC